ncbi:MAG TPA: M1 family aminopeptidase [Bryobacteraceae bacterium]|nr:M1 family aminopeptidase [Bryobacteraceae bacterium]
MRRVCFLFFSLCPALAMAAPNAADLARQVREMSLDPAECYRVRDVALHKDEARMFLTDGYLIFAKPVTGVRMSAVFTASVEGGDAELLLLPPNLGERRSLASYTGSPNLDEHLAAAVLIFSDDTYAKLMEQIHQSSGIRKSAEMGALMADRWTPVVRNVATSFQSRLVWDLLMGEPQTRGFFAMSMIGNTLGNFDLYYDRRSREQIAIGKLNTRDDVLFFDIWCSFVARSFRNREIEPDFSLDDFRIQAALQPDLNLQVHTKVTLKPTRELPVLAFDIAEPMTVTAVLVDGRPAEVLERDSLRAQLVRNVGNEMFLVVPPSPLEPGREYEVEFRNEGKVIFDAGNQVYYVGARSNWFPNSGLQFAKYDLTFRYPKDLDLVIPGDLVDEHEEGDWRITHRKTGVPIRFAGFNLGRYERLRVSRDGYTVEVCANRAVEPALAGEQPEALPETLPPHRVREPEIVLPPMPQAPHEPVERLREIASEITAALEFMAARFGPPALKTLTVAPVPGRFGQGFPGLIYLSTMSYLAPRESAMRTLDAHGRLFFSEVLQAHETAHQWWGNVVTAAGYHDEWLMEALADYSALLYLENRSGPQPVALELDEYKANLLQKTAAGQTVESTGPIVLGLRLENSQAPQAYHAITYGKGSWIMHMLRRRMGDDRFIAMLADLRKEYEHKPLSTEDFRSVAARFLPAHSDDPDLESFFDQWVYGTGIPSLKLKYTVRGKGPSMRLNGTITQSDAGADFSTLVPVDIRFSHGKSKTVWVRTADGAATFSVQVAQTPAKVLLDPDDSVLRH